MTRTWTIHIMYIVTRFLVIYFLTLSRFIRGVQAVYRVWGKVRPPQADQGDCHMGQEETKIHPKRGTDCLSPGQALPGQLLVREARRPSLRTPHARTETDDHTLFDHCPPRSIISGAVWKFHDKPPTIPFS